LTSSGKKRLYGRDQTLEESPRGAAQRPASDRGRARPLSAASPDPSAALPVALEWHRTIFGVGIGATGLVVEDLDGDGRPEIVAAAGPRAFWSDLFWYVLSFRNGEYRPVFVSDPVGDPYAVEIGAVRVARIGGVPKILVAAGPAIQVYDGATRELQRTITTQARQIGSLAVADLDGNGHLDLVFSDDYSLFDRDLYVYDLDTGTERWKGPGLGGQDVAVGDVDDDPALEIVVGNDTDPGYVIDGRTHALEWTNPWGFGRFVRIGDVDGDGRAEIVAGYAWDGIRVFRAADRALVRSIPVDLDIGAMRLFDLDGGGRPKIVYGDGQWGGLHAVDGLTGAELWTIPNPSYGYTDIALGDVDGDGTAEILWGAGYHYTGPDHLYVYDSVLRQQEWESPDINGPFKALAHGDVDGDGHPELVYGSAFSDSEYADGLWFVHDAATKEPEFASGRTTGRAWEGLRRIRTANVDADPQEEIFVAASDLYTPMILCYDGLTHEEQWRLEAEDGLRFDSLEVVDLDGDGHLELVAGTGREHTGASGVYVYVFDAETGTQKWRSASLADGFSSLSLLRVADVDGDGKPEIVVADLDWIGARAIYVVSPATHAARHLGLHETTSLATPDRDGDGIAEIVIGTREGGIQVLDPATGAVRETLASYGGRIDGLNVVDVGNDGVADYVFAMEDRLYIYDGRTGTQAWASPIIGGRPGYAGDGVGADDSLLVADVDEDGRLEIVVNLGDTGLRVYEIRPGLSVAQRAPAGPLEVSDTITYSVTVDNHDQGPATDVTLTDTLPAGVALLSVSASQGSCAAAAVVTCTLGTLDPSVTATVHLEVAVRQPGMMLVNIATATRAESDPYPADDTSVRETWVLELPKLVVSSLSLKEPAAGAVDAVVRLSLSRASRHAVTASYATEDGTALAGADYLRRTGALRFPPGTVRLEVRIPVKADALREPNEFFRVKLADPTLAAIDGPGRVTIVDRPPRVRGQ
jgi:uncharacterized repeat protein (TIGR01451 family)